jgi:hypothetical protein
VWSNHIGRFSEQLYLTGAKEIRSPEARRREPRTHSYRHGGALHRFQHDPALRSGRPARNRTDGEIFVKKCVSSRKPQSKAIALIGSLNSLRRSKRRGGMVQTKRINEFGAGRGPQASGKQILTTVARLRIEPMATVCNKKLTGSKLSSKFAEKGLRQALEHQQQAV